MEWPKVTVITPTKEGRHLLLEKCRKQFEAQDYSEKQHIILNGNGTIFDKLNKGCEVADGEIILRFDDDDFYAPDWITRSVQFLIESKADITGIDHAYFYKPGSAMYEYQYTGQQPYVLGATMCFWRKTWERSKKKFYAYTKIGGRYAGEDKLFCVNNGVVIPHDYKDGFMAMLHSDNTSSKFVTTNQYAKKVNISIANRILNAQG